MESQTAHFETICSLKLETGRAWSYKELLRDLWKQPDAKRAGEYFDDGYKRVIYTKLDPVKKLTLSRGDCTRFLAKHS